MRPLRTLLLVALAAFCGAAVAGLPPIRDGLDQVSERAHRRWAAPRRGDVHRAVRWFQEDRRTAWRLPPDVVERIVRARVRSLRPRERAVYGECGRRDLARVTRNASDRPHAPRTGPLPVVSLPSTGPIRIDRVSRS